MPARFGKDGCRGDAKSPEIRDKNHIPRGLLLRAGFERIKGNCEQARSDLDETLEVAIAGRIKLFEVDARLQYSLLHLEADQRTDVSEHLRNATRVIAESGYRRRQLELISLEAREAGIR